jgi:TPP-dependent indolepyruvate ferredoxin oxidoreductase alpha subunit
MIVVNDRFCPQNHRCPAISHCPQDAIVQEDIYSAPRIDHELCTECGACTEVCRTFYLVRDEAARREEAPVA